MRRMGSKGFTLIELVMVIVIIGILAAVAIPKFYDMTTKAKEAAAKGALGALRSAVAMWYANNAVTGTSARWPASAIELASAMSDGNIPVNPMYHVNSCTNVDIIAASTTSPNAQYAWIYSSAYGKVWAGNNTTW